MAIVNAIGIALAAKNTVEPIWALAASMRQRAAEIIVYAKHRIDNGKVEGFNNPVSPRLIHRTNGIRSILCLFRRAWAAVIASSRQVVCGSA